MTRFTWLCLSLFALTLSAATAQTPDSGTGRVYFMRSTGFQGSLVAFTVFIDDQLVCKLNQKRFSIHTLKPGQHSFSAQFGGKKSKQKAERITVTVEAGKTYYIQLVFQPGAFVNNLYCQEVTENSAKTVLPDLEEDTRCQ